MSATACITIAKTYDYVRYLCQLVAPADKRADLCVLLAFHAEIAKIPGVVSEPMLGMIRLAWWREALDELYSGKPPRGHEVLQALADVIPRYRLQKQHFMTILSGRECDLEAFSIKDDDALIGYTDQVYGALLLLMAEILGNEWEGVHPYALLLGRIWGVVDICRSAIRSYDQSQCLFPLSRLYARGIEEKSFFATQLSPQLSSVMSEMLLLADGFMANAIALEKSQKSEISSFIMMRRTLKDEVQTGLKATSNVHLALLPKSKLLLQLKVLLWAVLKTK